MYEIGYAALVLTLLFSIYGAGAAYYGARKGYRELIESAQNAVYAVGALTTIASSILFYALISKDYTLEYVASYVSNTQELVYLIAAFWGGNQGSLLLWAWVLGVMSVVTVWQNKEEHRDLIPYVIPVLLGIEIFFTTLMLSTSNPFARLAYPPLEGNGLNPLLLNMGMFFHPTTLYLGYVGFAIPFAFAMAALITGQLGDRWIKVTRRWTLFAWFFLTLGNLFGAQWAYVELGWGGFWAWDPVENASFMPWLTGTAFLHSVMIQERRGMLKVWNMVLIIATFSLTIFGTFLTRSGVISSVHAFGQSNLGPYFMGFLGLILIGSLSLLFFRMDDLEGDNELDSFVSRESTFLLNNLILVGAAFATFWGTVFPIISEAVRGTKITVSAPFFNQVNMPIFLVLIFIMGVCPLIGWRRASKENLIRNFLYPAAVGLLLAGGLFVVGVTEFLSILPFALSAFVLMTIGVEWFRGVNARHKLYGEGFLIALLRLVWSNKRRYGGYIVHFGVIMIAIGITGAYSLKTEKDARLNKGEQMTIGSYTLEYIGQNSYSTRSYDVKSAGFNVYQDGKLLEKLTPGKNFYPRDPNPSTEVAIRTTLKEDLYLILAGWNDDGSVDIKALINPLVVWLWIGGVVSLVGTTVAFWPDAKEKRRRVTVRNTAEDFDDSRSLQPMGS